MRITCDVGYEGVNNMGYKFKVIEIVRVNGKTKRKVLFDSGYSTLSDPKEIKNGSIRDWLSPYVCGKGIVGLEIENPQSHILYNRWRDMIRRCYDSNNKSYKTYGGNGCWVCDDWLYFPNYVKDIEKKENYDKLVESKGKNLWQIDKDILKPGNKCYCDKYVSIISRTKNAAERNKRVTKTYLGDKIHQFSLNGEYIKSFDSKKEAAIELSKNHSRNTTSINEYLKGNFAHAFHYAWVSDEDFNSMDILDIKNKILHQNSKFKKDYSIKYKKYYQYDLNGNLINTYNKPSEIISNLNYKGKSMTGFYKAINNNVSWNGFIWKAELKNRKNKEGE